MTKEELKIPIIEPTIQKHLPPSVFRYVWIRAESDLEGNSYWWTVGDVLVTDVCHFFKRQTVDFTGVLSWISMKDLLFSFSCSHCYTCSPHIKCLVNEDICFKILICIYWYLPDLSTIRKFIIYPNEKHDCCYVFLKLPALYKCSFNSYITHLLNLGANW